MTDGSVEVLARILRARSVRTDTEAWQTTSGVNVPTDDASTVSREPCDNSASRSDHRID